MPNDHYYSRQPSSPSQRQELSVPLRGEAWRFITDRGVFSGDRLDPGSRLLIECLAVQEGDRVLDVGAGYGPIGLVAARLVGPTGQVTLVEVNERAAGLAVENAALNRIENATVLVTDDLAGADLPPQDVVVTNPPVRAGWPVVMPLLAAAAGKLRPGGAFWLVGFKHLGVNTLGKRLAELVGEPEVMDRGGGYRVLRAVREAGHA